MNFSSVKVIKYIYLLKNLNDSIYAIIHHIIIRINLINFLNIIYVFIIHPYDLNNYSRYNKSLYLV